MRYEPNSAGIDKLNDSDEFQALVLERAALGAAEARSRAPVESGDYRESITVYADRAGDRVGAVVTATAPYAQFIEQIHHVFATVVDRIERA